MVDRAKYENQDRLKKLQEREMLCLDITEIEEMRQDGEDEDPQPPAFSQIDLQEFATMIKTERAGKWPRLNGTAADAPVLNVYNACAKQVAHNVLGPRLSLANQNNVQAWRDISTSHPDDKWIIECIEYGFPLQYRGPPMENHFDGNHPSAENYQAQVTAYIKKEVQIGGLVGPFDDVPFTPWCNLAPIMTREKATKSERRIIVDLSFPEDNGPNSFITKNLVFGRKVTHALPSVNDAVRIITSLDFNVVLSTVDIARAYRNFNVDPLDWPLTCIWYDNQYYVDICMPFGSRLSSLYMQRMACCIQRALLQNGIISVVYLDDLLVICRKNQDPDRQFGKVIAMVRALGLPIAWEKVVGPTTSLRFLGVIIDVDRREIRMPKDKIQKFLQLIDEIYHKKSISKRAMQSLLGHVNHLGKGVPAARLFINRLLASLRGTPMKYIPMDRELRRDLDWFREFLAEYNGRTLILTPDPVVSIEADSCLTGGGACMDHRCYAIVYPRHIADNMHISQLEALNCVVAARVFLEEKSDLCAQIVCDNEGAVACFTSGRARDPVIGAMCRAFWYFAARRNIKFIFVHRPGESMVIADALSRKYRSENDRKWADNIVRKFQLEYISVDDCYLDFDNFL